MPLNQIFDNTYFVTDSATSGLSWPSGGARIQSIVLHCLNTLAVARFEIYAGTPIFQFSFIQAGSNSTTTFPSDYVFPIGGVRFQTAWIPTTLTACSAWINFV